MNGNGHHSTELWLAFDQSVDGFDFVWYNYRCTSV